jgi:hypothetical protein
MQPKLLSLSILTGLSVVWMLSDTAQGRAEVMELEIIRTKELPGCTIGTMGVNNASLAASLELPWHDNKENVSRVPAGRYKSILRYDHRDAWRLELVDVPGRGHIQIHIGNWPSDTNGCILVGKINRGKCAVEQSTEAYADLKRAFYGSKNPAATPSKSVVVSIQDVS